MNNDNNKLAINIIILFVSMLLLSFAAVPIYNLFCKATGFAGTVKQLDNIQEVHNIKKGTKKIRIYFDANIDKDLPWKFVPKNKYVDLVAGEITLVFYEAENLSKEDIMGTAIYNITPDVAGGYFVKVHCFCFEKQLLKSGSKMLMPVAFYIDPSIKQNKELNDLSELTLSYSFFKLP